MEGLGLGFVANHFDVVPVRTNDESGMVARVVVRSQARRAIVFAARLQSRAIESIDLLAFLGRRDNGYAERFECLEEERFARCVVADAEFDGVKHEFSKSV